MISIISDDHTPSVLSILVQNVLYSLVQIIYFWQLFLFHLYLKIISQDKCALRPQFLSNSSNFCLINIKMQFTEFCRLILKTIFIFKYKYCKTKNFIFIQYIYFILYSFASFPNVAYFSHLRFYSLFFFLFNKNLILNFGKKVTF